MLIDLPPHSRVRHDIRAGSTARRREDEEDKQGWGATNACDKATAVAAHTSENIPPYIAPFLSSLLFANGRDHERSTRRSKIYFVPLNKCLPSLLNTCAIFVVCCEQVFLLIYSCCNCVLWLQPKEGESFPLFISSSPVQTTWDGVRLPCLRL